MSTRGTYNVENTLLYNHWDNYPSGASYHFIEVIKKCGNLSLFSIIRGMERVEKATSKFDGPADFHYEIKDQRIICYSIAYDKDELTYRSSGSVEEWINDNFKYSDLEETDDINDYIVVKLNDNRYNTVNGVFDEAKKCFDNGIRMTNSGHTGNGSSEFKRAFDLFRTSTKDFKGYSDIYNLIYVPFFVKAYNHNDDTLFLSYSELAKETIQ
jgi:hypothetical protein